MARRRLLWQLFPTYVLITVLSIVAATWYASRNLRLFYIDSTAADLRARARILRNDLPVPLSAQNHGDIDRWAKAHGGLWGTRITLIEPSGRVLADSDKDPALMENHADRPEIMEAMNGNPGRSLRYSSTLNTNMLYVAIPMTPDALPSPVLRTSVSVASIDAALREIYRQIAFGGVVIVLVVSAISLLVSRRITRPLVELRRGAERFAKGELGERMHTSASEEIDALAASMNAMAAQLDARIRTIHQQRSQEEAILASMVECVLAVDTEERVLTMNAAAADMFALQSTDAIGRPIQEVIRNPQVHRLVGRTLASDAAVEGELRLFDPDERFLQVHGTGLRDPAGENIGALLVINDITRLRRLEQVRRDFVANVSHELKTPITAIKGFVETLQGGALDDRSDAARFLKIIARHTERLDAILEDLLSLSRIEKDAEGAGIDLVPGKVLRVLRSAIEVCRERAQARSVALNLRGDERAVASINPRLLEQAVVNLIDNAIKYTDPGGAVDVAMRGDPEEIRIAVTDTGCGIAPEHLPRLFERFYRPDTARSRELGGTGLGLAIVKHIVLAHRGRVTVNSTMGVGSTFMILLPLLTDT